MKRKIGIFTFHNVYNYGAILQAFALNSYLNNKENDCRIVNYNSKVLMEPYKLFQTIDKNINIFLKQLIICPLIIIKNFKFKRFIKKYIKTTTKLFYREDVEKEILNFDYIITGSDQVWNTDITKSDQDIYLLDFNYNITKMSYAASFGKEKIKDEEKEYIKKQLSTYKNIGVREKSGIRILEEIGINNAVEVLDPTFLLSKEEWINSLNLKKNDKKYILLYMLGINDKLIQLAKRISQKMEIPIITFDYKKKNNKYLSDPKDFVKLIYNAEIVLTNSFHGLALSIILNKEFWVTLNENRNTRIINLLEKLNLSNRIVEDIEKISKKEIDYLNVNKILEKEIEKSKNFLDKMES